MKNEAKRKVIGKLPIPACDMAHPPKLNESISWLIPKSARSFDNYLSKLQRLTTDAMGPIAWLWDKMQPGSVDMNTARSAIHSSLLLIGNASAHFNVERRKAIMKHLNTDIKFLAEAEFPDGGPYLFGKDFGKRAKAAADDVRALKGIQSKKGNRFSGSGDSNKKTKYTSQSRRQNWGVNSWSQRSVFSRLDKPFQAGKGPSFRKSYRPPKQAHK